MRMRLLILLLASVALSLSCAPCMAGGAAPLTSIQQVTDLTNAQAAQSLPVSLEATVLFVQPPNGTLFVLEGKYGVYVRFRQDIGLIPGDLVQVSGVTASSFRPIVTGPTVRFLRHGPMPKPVVANFEDLIQSKLDCRYVQITGRVLSSSLDDNLPHAHLHIRLQVPDGTVEGVVNDPGELQAEDILDAEVRITGVAGGEFDGKMQLAGVELDVNSWRDVTVVKKASTDPWSMPIIPMDAVIYAFRSGNQSQRVRIAGTLTYFEPGFLAVVEQRGRSMMINTNSTLAVHAGMGVEATGYPVVYGESVGLENAQLRPIEQPPPGPPQLVNWEDASVGKYTYDLVAMEGQVVGVLHDSRVDLFLIVSDGHLFSATLRHSSSDANDGAAGAPTPEVGSKVRVTGVCFVDLGNHWRDRLWFDLRMRTLNDIVILQPPSWWTVKRLAYVVTMLSAVILIAVIWTGLLERQLRHQNSSLAKQNEEDAIRERHLARHEQERSHILELVSSPAPLQEVLREIQSMVSSRLYGAHCWFELHGTSEGGSIAERPSGPGIVYVELFSPEGRSLGYLLATPRLQVSAGVDASAPLAAGARLAELAIDTRRLYSDLHHRSEYDLLTDIPNRFSMEKKLDQLMLSARGNEAVFGLIYVDLDRFKQVNDRYGHHIGDLYLQEATRRMKLQLRTGDVLARIGGDEFIALAPILRGRADAEEIAVRLERCFDEPFELEGYRMQASASVGLAVYPEDATTKEELLRSADAAMYAHKLGKREEQGSHGGAPHQTGREKSLR